MQAREIAYDILYNLEGTSRISDDSEINIEQIYFKIDTTRALLIRQDQSKGRSLSDNIMQTISCVEVIQVSASECCGITSDCTILRTKFKLPRPIELHQKDLVVRVSGVNIESSSWNQISYAKLQYAGKSFITKDSTKWFLKDNYLYIINPPNIKMISVSLVAEQPSDLARFSSCAGAPCYSVTDEYPISAHMIPTLKQLILEDLLRGKQMPSDEQGDESNKVQNKINK